MSGSEELNYMERILIDQVASIGGVVLPMSNFHRSGLPSHQILLPFNRCLFLDIKIESTLTFSQIKTRHIFRKIKHSITTVYNIDQLRYFLNKLNDYLYNS